MTDQPAGTRGRAHDQDQPRSVGDTIDRLADLIETRGLKVFAVIDQADEVAYLSPRALAARHGLGPELAGNLAGIDPLAEALVTS